jgi:DNA-binding beta-propeller fold protein YncE
MMRLAIFFCLFPVALAAQEPALVVVEKKVGEVAFYTSAGERVAGVKVGETPHEMVLDPDGRRLYVSDNGVLWMDYEGPGGNTISIVDIKARKKVGVIPLGKYHRPHGMSFDPKTRRMLVTSENPDSLVLVDPDSRSVVEAYDNGGKAPHMVMFDRAGEWAYASNTNSNNIVAVRVGSGQKRTIEGCAGPQGGVLTSDGSRYYVTCRDSGTIQILDSAGKQPIGEIKTGKGVNRINLTPDEETLVYSIGGEGKQVGFADVATGKETGRADLGGHPLSCSLSKDGRYAFAGVQDNDEIYVVSVAERKVIQVIRTPAGHGPDPVMEIGSYRPPR